MSTLYLHFETLWKIYPGHVVKLLQIDLPRFDKLSQMGQPHVNTHSAKEKENKKEQPVPYN